MKQHFLRKAIAIAIASGAYTVPSLANSTSLQLEEVVVIARKIAESVQDIPVAVSVFDGQTAKDLNIKNVQGVMEFTPGATISGSAPGEQRLSIRGVSSSDFSASGGAGVLMMVDEEVISRDFMYSANMFDISRIEVLRGPQGTTYGKNAAGGVVHLLSNRPHQDGELFAKINVGNYGLIETEAMINGALSDTVAGRIAVYHQNVAGYSDDFQTGSSVDDNEHTAARASVLFEPSDDLEIILRMSASRDQHDNPAPRKLREPGLPDSFFGMINFVEPSDHPWTVSNSDDLSYDRDIFALSSVVNWTRDNYILTSITTYREGDDASRVDLFGTSDDLVIQNIENDASTWSQELRISRQNAASSISWLAGVYYLSEQHERGERLEIFANNPTFTALGLNVEQQFLQKNEGVSYGLFGELNYDISDFTTVSAGLRYSYDEKDYRMDHRISYSALSPIATLIASQFIENPSNPVLGSVSEDWGSITGKLTVNHQLTDSSNIYLSVGTGTKSGGFNPQPANQDALNKSYDEENVLSTELGIKSELLDNRLRLNVVLFNSNYRDIQTLGYLESGTAVTENAGEATIRGLEVDFMWLISAEFSLVGSYANYDSQYDSRMLDGQDLSGETLEEVPEWTGHIGAIYEHTLASSGLLRGRIDYRSRSDVLGLRDPNLGELDRTGKDIVNASVSWLSADDKWQLTVWGENLGDQAEMLVTGPSALFTQSRVSYGAPRTYGISVSYHL